MIAVRAAWSPLARSRTDHPEGKARRGRVAPTGAPGDAIGGYAASVPAGRTAGRRYGETFVDQVGRHAEGLLHLRVADRDGLLVGAARDGGREGRGVDQGAVGVVELHRVATEEVLAGGEHLQLDIAVVAG